ncbi:MAG: hypothetical protein ACPMAQ_16600, partial [Phycisphaerae bacterium]
MPFVPDEYQLHAKLAAVVLAALFLGRSLWGRIRRFQRSRRPVVLHPKLQKYGIDPEEAARERRELASTIVATSSGERLAGYEIVQQVEAVFVEGFRSPAEAIDGLKAAAARVGANAVINVRPERSLAGRCGASGDAVRVR